MSLPKRILLAFVVVFVAIQVSMFIGIVVTRAMPRVYAATALIQVPNETCPTCGRNAKYDRFFLMTQREIMRSTPVIEEVVRELNLHEILGKAYGYYERMNAEAGFERTVSLVKEKVSFDIFRDTDLIAITVKLDMPQKHPNQAATLAAEIANQIARSFMSWDMRKMMMVKEAGLAKLQQELDEQDRRIAAQEQKVTDSQEKDNLTVMTELEIMKKRRDSLAERMNDERIKIEIPRQGVQIIQPAKVVGEAAPVSPNIMLNMMLSVIAGALIGCIIALFILFGGIKINALFGKLSIGTPVAFVVFLLCFLALVITGGNFAERFLNGFMVFILCLPFIGLLCAIVGALKKESQKAYYIVGLVSNAVLGLFVSVVMIQILCFR